MKFGCFVSISFFNAKKSYIALGVDNVISREGVK